MGATEVSSADVIALLHHVGQHVLVAGRPEASASAHQKSPGEVVTAMDVASERALREGLADIDPQGFVVGEESAHADPTLLDGLAQHASVWIVDPLDGTGAYVRGDGPFGIMLARLHHGRAVQSWIHLPLTGETAHAVAGGGAWLEDARLQLASVAHDPLRVALQTRFFPDDARARADAMDDVERTDRLHLCAAQRYVDLARGVEDAAAFWRTLPWDHAPGDLLVREAGGVVARWDGSAFDPTDTETTSLLVARSPETWETVQRRLRGAS